MATTLETTWDVLSAVVTYFGLQLFTDTSDEPDDDEIVKARRSSGSVVFRLELCHELIKRRFPERTDALSTINKINEILRQEHGGILPDVFFKRWYDSRVIKGLDRQAYTPEERKKLVETLKRWKDLRQSFDEDDLYHNKLRGEILFDRDVSQIMQHLQDWLRKRYGHTT